MRGNLSLELGQWGRPQWPNEFCFSRPIQKHSYLLFNRWEEGVSLRRTLGRLI
jgi:hypothetical protein